MPCQRKDIMGYLKECWDVGSIKHQTLVNAIEAYTV